MTYLSKPSEGEKLDPAALMARVIAQGGPGGYRQVWRLLKLRLRGTGIDIGEFYQFGMWRRDAETRQLIREFLPTIRRKAFNDVLLVPSRGVSTETIVDKLLTERLIREAGLPSVRTLACVGAPPPDRTAITHLADGDAIRAYLADPAHLPVFGKPRSDSMARGAVVIDRLAPDGQSVILLNGKVAPLADLAVEIINDWGTGYVFQPFYRNHSALAPHVGEAMACVRIVTLRTDRGIEPYYAMLRIPVKGAMHDGDHVGQRAWALIDHTTGRITRLRDMRDALSPDWTHWLNKDQPLLGLTLPHWEQAMQTVIRAHDLFLGHGILGWDVFLTDEGALINETNANPGHIYQIAAQRGLLNPDLHPIYERALAYAKRINAQSTG